MFCHVPGRSEISPEFQLLSTCPRSEFSPERQHLTISPPRSDAVFRCSFQHPRPRSAKYREVSGIPCTARFQCYFETIAPPLDSTTLKVLHRSISTSLCNPCTAPQVILKALHDRFPCFCPALFRYTAPPRCLSMPCLGNRRPVSITVFRRILRHPRPASKSYPVVFIDSRRLFKDRQKIPVNLNKT